MIQYKIKPKTTKNRTKVKGNKRKYIKIQSDSNIDPVPIFIR